MSTFELNQIYLQLDYEINHLTQSTIAFHRNAIKEDTRRVISDLKSEIEEWISLLNERKITCYEIENLLELKSEQIKLTKLESKGVEKEKLEMIKNDIFGMTARAIFNTYLNSLFRNPTRARTKDFRKVNWF